ncbi:MAG: hypothetical protein HQL96_05430 [Magnetococcales bacterium]|nr:hypothetical protein [Magnetococcales bacterium]
MPPAVHRARITIPPFFLLILLLVGSPLRAGTDAVRVSWTAVPIDEAQLELTLHVIGLRHFFLESRERTLVIRLERPLDPAGLAELIDAHGAWISDLRYGYDSLALQWKGDTRAWIESGPERLRMRLERDASRIPPVADRSPSALETGETIRDRKERLRNAATVWENGLRTLRHPMTGETRHLGYLDFAQPLNGPYRFHLRMEGERITVADAMAPGPERPTQRAVAWQASLAREEERFGMARIELHGRDRPGIGVAGALPNGSVTWSGNLQWRVPNPDESVALLHGGTRDQLALHGRRAWREDLDTSLGVILRQYHLEEVPAAARGLGAVARLGQGGEAWLAGRLELGVELERAIHQGEWEDGRGNRIHPYPKPSRRNLTADWSRQWEVSDYLTGMSRVSHRFEQAVHKNTSALGLGLELLAADDWRFGLEAEGGLAHGPGADDPYFRVMFWQRVLTLKGWFK